jgi:tetratricopeptide (TPR) repeat protein/uncharacterized RDD family membrane protein YckC
MALAPAPLGKRVAAAVIDGILLVVLCIGTFIAPLLMRGFVVPMWGVLVVLIGYSVVPLAALKRTLGMQLFNLELARLDGHAVDIANLLFREFVGRGLFPAAYLITILGGLIAQFFGIGGLLGSSLLTGIMTIACLFAVSLAAAGNLIALDRKDKRTLADLMAKSMVVEGVARPPPTDADDLIEFKLARRSTIVKVIIVEVVLLSSLAALPWLLTRKTGAGQETYDRVARIRIKSLEAEYSAKPNSDKIFNDLAREYRMAGRDEDLQKLMDQKDARLMKRETEREKNLREMFAKEKTRETAGALIELLETQDRGDDAEVVYREWLGETPEASAVAGFSNWLLARDRNETARAEAERALRMNPLVAYGHTFMGIALWRLGKLPEAREELLLALMDDPEDDDASDALSSVKAEIGPLDASGTRVLEKRFKLWTRDAGR